MPLSFKIWSFSKLVDFSDIDEELSFSDLYMKINKETGVKIDDILLSKENSLLEIEDLQYPIGAFIENNDTLTLIVKPVSSSASSPPSSSCSSSVKHQSTTLSHNNSPLSKSKQKTHSPLNGVVRYGRLKNLRIFKRDTLNDNSCLFHALHQMLQVYCVESPYSLRELVSNTIMSNPSEYMSFLSKPVDEYVQWILKEISWGGAVELSIVSKFFNIEIDAINIQDLTIFRFNHAPDPEDEAKEQKDQERQKNDDSKNKDEEKSGEREREGKKKDVKKEKEKEKENGDGKEKKKKEKEKEKERSEMNGGKDTPNPTARGIVCYNGSHYDLFAFNYDKWHPACTDVTLFDMKDPQPLEMALEVCTDMKKLGMFVEDEMELVCEICGEKLIGNNGVLCHGQETSHYNFRPLK